MKKKILLDCTLTADLFARPHGRSDPTVHPHRGRSLNLLLLVPLVGALLDPIGEWCTHQGVDDIPNIISGQLLTFLGNGQGIDDLLMAHSIAYDIIYAKLLILGYEDDLNVIAVDLGLGAIHEILQVIGGARLVRRQVGLN